MSRHIYTVPGVYKWRVYSPMLFLSFPHYLLPSPPSQALPRNYLFEAQLDVTYALSFVSLGPKLVILLPSLSPRSRRFTHTIPFGMSRCRHLGQAWLLAHGDKLWANLPHSSRLALCIRIALWSSRFVINDHRGVACPHTFALSIRTDLTGFPRARPL